MPRWMTDKKQKIFSVFLFLFIFFVLIITPITQKRFLLAETISEIKNKIEQKNLDIERLEKEIKYYQGQLDTLDKQKNSLNNSLKKLEITRKKLLADISVTESQIEKTNFKIQELSSSIGNKRNAIEKNISAISAGLREIKEMEELDPLATILSEKSFTALWNNADNISSVAEEMRKKIILLKEVKNELEINKQSETAEKNQLVALKNKLKDQKKIIEQNTREKQKILSQTKNSETNYQKILKNQLVKREAFEKELREYESRLKFALDPSSLPDKGVLSWPLDDIYVTQEFGAKTGPHRTYASGHSGTDFRARTPLPVKSMADGVVKGTGNTDDACPGASFGGWILVEYDNGLSSTFAHLSLIKVEEGEKVKRGQVVGYTGGTGRVTGPHLHISLYASKAVSVQTVPSKSCPGKILKQPISAISGYLDPMYYLPPYNKGN